MANIPNPQAPQMATVVAKPTSGLKAMCGIVGVLAMITSVVGLIEPDRRLGITEFPDPALAFGAAVGAILIPAVIAFIVFKVASRRAGLVTFLILAALVTLLGLVAIANTWIFKL